MKTIDCLLFDRHSWLRRRLPKPPSEAPPANRPSAVLRHRQLATVQQQQSSNGDRSTFGNGSNNNSNDIYSNHNQMYNTSSKNYSSTNELNRHHKLPHIGGLQLNSILD